MTIYEKPGRDRFLTNNLEGIVPRGKGGERAKKRIEEKAVRPQGHKHRFTEGSNTGEDVHECQKEFEPPGKKEGDKRKGAGKGRRDSLFRVCSRF